MIYPEASGVPANMLPRKDASAFEQLKQLVDTEPASLADPDWIGLLAAIGIEKGKPFRNELSRAGLPWLLPSPRFLADAKLDGLAVGCVPVGFCPFLFAHLDCRVLGEPLRRSSATARLTAMKRLSRSLK